MRKEFFVIALQRNLGVLGQSVERGLRSPRGSHIVVNILGENCYGEVGTGCLPGRRKKLFRLVVATVMVFFVKNFQVPLQ